MLHLCFPIATADSSPILPAEIVGNYSPNLLEILLNCGASKSKCGIALSLSADTMVLMSYGCWKRQIIVEGM
jgi:hypothetical protein